MVQVLHLSNGDTINKKLAAKENRVTSLLKSSNSDNALIEEIYLTCLSRYPTENETSRLQTFLKDAKTPEDRRIIVEDLFWAILSSREFLFNH